MLEGGSGNIQMIREICFRSFKISCDNRRQLVVKSEVSLKYGNVVSVLVKTVRVCGVSMLVK